MPFFLTNTGLIFEALPFSGGKGATFGILLHDLK